MFVANATRPTHRGWHTVFTTILGTFFVPLRYLNTMIIIPKHNSPFSDVSTSNGSNAHSGVSHPIGGYLLGEYNGEETKKAI